MQRERKRAPQRRIDELPDPSQSHEAEVNKLQQVFAARVDPTIKEAFDMYVRKSGQTKRAITERALKREMGLI